MAITRRRGASTSVLKYSFGPSLPRKVNSCSKLSIKLDGHRVGLGQVADHDPLPGVGPHDDRDHQVAAVFGDLAVILPIGMLRPIVDQHVGILRRAEAMVEELVVEVQRLELGAGLGSS